MPPASKIAIFCLISLELVGRVSGEVSDNAVGIIQIEHLKDGVGSLAVLTFHDGVLDAAMLFSNTALPCRRIHAYSGLETEISISGFACISL